MRAAILHQPGLIETSPLHIVQAPEPAPAPGEVLIRVRACGVCRTDLHVVEGELPARRMPLIPGHQVVGTIERLGDGVTIPTLKAGDRVGVAWLHRTCGRCRFCAAACENLCERAEFTGWTADGGFAELITAPAAFVYPIPPSFSDVAAAPLLCAGIIGFRAMRLTGLDATLDRAGRWHGARLGIYGFGAAGHVAIQLAVARGAEVFVCTRDRERHQVLAGELGAKWVGGAMDAPPQPLDAAIVFAPAGELVPPAMHALARGGVLVLGGIHMSDIPAMPYRLLYHERVVRSVANNTRADGREFLIEAAALPVRTRIEVFPLERVNEALQRLKHDAIKGAAVISLVDES